MEHDSLVTRIERELTAQADLHVNVEESGEALTLTGRVPSNEARQAAEDIALAIAPDRRIDNDLEVEVVLPGDVTDVNTDQPGSSDLPETIAEIQAEGAGLAEDFTDQPLSTTTVDAYEGLTDSSDPVDEGSDEPAFFPPTDPVVATDDQGQTTVAGGFAPTSMDEVEVERSALDNLPGDEAMADAIRRELREDALTTDLAIHVTVRARVAHLRGAVPTLEDAEHAEEVASRIPGVREVREDLEISDL